MRLVQQEDDARRLGPREFGLFTSWSDEVRISCNDGSRKSQSVEAGITIITLPTDCMAETNTVILRPHVDIEPQHTIHDNTLHFPPSILKVANASTATLKALRSQQESLEVHFAPSPALGWLTEHLDSFGGPIKGVTGAKIAIIVACILLCLILGAILLCCCCRKKGNNGGTVNNINLGAAAPAQSAPSAPNFNIANTPFSYLDLKNRLLS